MGSSINDFSEVNMLKKIVEEVTPTILSWDPLQNSLAHSDVKNYNDDGYMKKVNALFKPLNSRTTLPWTIKYE